MVCQTLPEEEIQSCTEFVLENWRGMAPAMFASDSEIPTDICIGLGFCEPFLDRTVIHLLIFFWVKGALVEETIKYRFSPYCKFGFSIPGILCLPF